MREGEREGEGRERGREGGEGERGGERGGGRERGGGEGEGRERGSVRNRVREMAFTALKLVIITMYKEGQAIFNSIFFKFDFIF